MTSTPTFSQDIPIPDDVMKAADEACRKAYDPSTETWLDVRDVVARAIMADRQRDQWQGISLAPKDGSLILAYDGFDRQIVRWGSLHIRSIVNGKLVNGSGWCEPGRIGSRFRAKQWQPLPPAPSIQGEG